MIDVARRTSPMPSRNQLQLSADFGAVFVILSLAWLMVGPRITLLELGGSSIRFEDFLLLTIFLYVLVTPWRPAFSFNRHMAVVVGVAFVAFLVAIDSKRVHPAISFLYTVRPLEYWVVLLAAGAILGAGAELSRRRLVGLLGFVTVAQVLVAASQAVLGLDVGFSKVALDRAAGLTAGPYELAGMCASLTGFWLLRQQYFLAGVAGLGVVLSASRVSVLAVGLVLVYAVVVGVKQRKVGLRWRVDGRQAVAICFSLAVFAAGFALSDGSALSDSSRRISETNIFESFQRAEDLATATPRVSTSDEYLTVAYGGLQGWLPDSSHLSDSSALIRFYRWSLLWDTVQHERAYALGLGPSFAGPSVDGSLLRIFVETGLLGMVAWAMLFRAMWRRVDHSARAALLAMVTGCLFIDLSYSMRTVTVLLVILAVGITPRRTELRSGRIHHHQSRYAERLQKD